MRKILYIFIVVVLVVLVGATYFYLYQGHRNVAEEQVDYTIDGAAMVQEFLTDEAKANKKYLDKTVLVKGKVTSVAVEENGLVLDEKVYATLTGKLPAGIQEASVVTLKGRFLGYDDLLGELKLDQCTLMEN